MYRLFALTTVVVAALALTTAAADRVVPTQLTPAPLTAKPIPRLAPAPLFTLGGLIGLQDVTPWVTSGTSMEPFILSGSVVLTRPLQANEPLVGQVVAFEGQGCVVPYPRLLHTVVSVSGDSVVTQGFNSPVADLCGLTKSKITGVWVATVGGPNG